MHALTRPKELPTPMRTTLLRREATRLLLPGASHCVVEGMQGSGQGHLVGGGI